MDAHFLTDIEIKKFKCFSDFKAEGFKRVNLIGGKNNIGKTAFMEACYINVHSYDINSLITTIIDIKFMRENVNLVLESEINRQTFLDATQDYIADSNLNKTHFSILNKDGVKEYSFNINNHAKNINANDIFIHPHFENNINFIDYFGWSNKNLAKAFQAIQKKDKEQELNSFVQGFDETIINFKVIAGKPQCKVYDDYQDIIEFGDGLRHYVSIICALYASANGTLFIDEIDNGIHYTQLDRLWEIILTLSKQNNCQVFTTTHSKEMIDSFARVSKRLDEQDISYTLLVKNKKKELATISLGYKDIVDSLIAHELEVR